MVITCRDCDTTLEKPKHQGRPPVRCPICRTEKLNSANMNRVNKARMKAQQLQIKVVETRYCLTCGLFLDPEWAVPDRIYCSTKCLNIFWYDNNTDYHKKLWKKNKALWTKSPTGKRGGVPMNEWFKMPKDFR